MKMATALLHLAALPTPDCASLRVMTAPGPPLVEMAAAGSLGMTGCFEVKVAGELVAAMAAVEELKNGERASLADRVGELSKASERGRPLPRVRGETARLR